MDWLLTQAEKASPLFSVGCILGIAVLWRQHISDQKTIATISKASSDASLAAALSIKEATATITLAMSKLALKIESGRRRR